MSKELQEYERKVFEDIKHIDENKTEFWYARELMPILEYTKWQNFEKVIKTAMNACDESKYVISEHFTEVSKVLEVGNSAKMKTRDYKLSRYACYLIVQNADPRKKTVALGQTYFAIQTRKMEITEEQYKSLSEDEKRLFHRRQTKIGNKILNRTAVNAGVKNLDKFHNFGYKGLYNGETADDIAKRKKLRYREDILDNMGSSELIANMFRIDLTNQKITNEHIKGEKSANEAHYSVGKAVRKTIEEQGGTMPEDLPTPEKIYKRDRKRENFKINKVMKLVTKNIIDVFLTSEKHLLSKNKYGID